MRIRAAAPRRGSSKTRQRKVKRKLVKRNGRLYRGDSSPYTLKPALQKINILQIEKSVRKNPRRFNTAKWTLLEIADQILQREIGMPRPALLKAHMVFRMFVRVSNRVRSGVKTPCHEWLGAMKRGAPALTTVNSIHGHRLIVDARKYILENPAVGKRRNFRSTPHNLCGNPLCVNPRHIEMRGLPHELKSGENHGRAKFTDKILRQIVREYNAGATAKQIAKRYRMSLTYVEQVMRKERRTEATAGMTIRGRFGER